MASDSRFSDRDSSSPDSERGAAEIRVSSIVETPRIFPLRSTRQWWEHARQLFGAEGGEVPRYARWRVDLEGHRIGRRLLFRGRLHAELGLTCGWCVEPIDHRVQESLELLLEPAQNASGAPAGGIELDPDDNSLGRYAGEALDFGPAILEILALAWPMQPCASDACPEACAAGQRVLGKDSPTAGMKSGSKNRPFAGLDELLRKAGGPK